MQNAPALPIGAILGSMLLAVAAVVSVVSHAGGQAALSESQIGLVAWALTLAIFGLQGVVSILLEGRELRPGRFAPRLTSPLSLVIGILSGLLFAVAAFLGFAIASGLSTAVVGSAAGAGCLVLALLMLLFKEAFVGHESHIDLRDDGVPW
jgi:hypothetical protein